MSVSIKYKGAEIASASTEVTKTIKTAGKYCEADILVENTPDGGDAPVINSLSVTANGTYTAPSGVDGYSPINVNVPAPTPTLQDKTITENGTYSADSGYDGLGEVVVNVSGGGGGEDPMSGSFTLPAPIKRVAGLFRDTTLPETFTLNLPATCTLIGSEAATGDYQLFRNVAGMKHLQINGSALTYDDGAISNNSVVEDVTYNDGSTELIMTSAAFLRCTNLKTINAVLNITGISSGNNMLGWSNNIENIRFKPNVIEILNMSRWSASHLTNASIVSLCNALKQGQSATASFNATVKSKLSAIYGTVAQDGGGIFTETGVTTDTTLAEFITNTKGWTIA